MAMTIGNVHGIDRTCTNCGLTYRYPQAKTFECLSCGAQQPWEGWPSPTTVLVNRGQRVEDSRAQEVPAHSSRAPAIDLRAVHAHLNGMSADTLRQLRDRLEILDLVRLANLAREIDPEYFARVRQALAGVGVRFGGG